MEIPKTIFLTVFFLSTQNLLQTLYTIVYIQLFSVSLMLCILFLPVIYFISYFSFLSFSFHCVLIEKYKYCPIFQVTVSNGLR